MNQYDIRNSLLLSDKARALQPEELVLWATMAEDALGLAGTGYTGEQADRAAMAVARQVNRMVAEPVDPWLIDHKRGEEQKSWESRSPPKDPLDPIAVMIVDQLAAESAGGGGSDVAGEYLIVPGFR